MLIIIHLFTQWFKRSYRYLFFMSMMAFSSMLWAQSFDPAFLQSTARHIETNEVMYTESFSKSTEGNQLRVIFRGPDGEHYASKILDFTKSRIQPEMKLVNDKLKLNTEILIQNNKALIKDSSQKRSNDIKEKHVALSAQTIIDVGLDHFIKQQWDVLVAGQTLAVQYLMTNDGKIYGLNIKHIPCSKLLKTQSTCFTAQLKNPIYRAVMGSTFFEYDNVTKTINRFKGVGQLFNEDGELEKVDITYHHQ